MPRKKPQNDAPQPNQNRAYGEGTISERPDGRFMIRVRINGERVTRYARDKKEAERKRRQLVHLAEQGTLVTAPQQTLKAHMEQWLDIRSVDWRAGTYSYHRQNAECHIFPVLGHVKLQKLTTEKIDAFYSHLVKEGLQPGTVRLIHGVLKRALNAAVKWQKITINPCNEVTLPRVPKLKYTILDQEGAKHLLETVKGHWFLEGLLTLALATGMRRGELLALTWKDIDFERKLLRVERTRTLIWNPDTERSVVQESLPKTANSLRTIALPDFALEALRVHRVRQMELRLRAKDWKEHNAVFCTRQGAFVWPMCIAASFKGVLKKAGLPNMRFHDLRHSAATILLEMGVPANVVQERLGHSDVKVTLGIYGHVTKGMQEKAILALDGLFQKQA